MTSFLNRSIECIAQSGALTNSKRPQSFVKGVYPTHVVSAFQARLNCSDGREYIDFICGLGSQLVGYANSQINEAVKKQLTKGTVYSLGSTLEVEYAERIKGLFPGIDRIKILKTGTEACMSSLKIARSYTQRNTVLSDGYHGWSDDFVSLTPPASGVPQRDFICQLPTDLDSICFKDIAAVIIEPVVTEFSEDRIEYLRKLRDLCTKNGTVLIFDETITGVRFEKLSVARCTGIIPDLLILGKALGGGFPLSVIGGRKDLMEVDYFVSSTFAGDTIAITASNALLDILTKGDIKIDVEWIRAKSFQDRFNEKLNGIVRIKGYPTRGILESDDLVTKAIFMQEACKAGMLFGSSWFWSTSHNDEIFHVLSMCEIIASRINNRECKLEGDLPMTPYAQKVRGK